MCNGSQFAPCTKIHAVPRANAVPDPALKSTRKNSTLILKHLREGDERICARVSIAGALAGVPAALKVCQKKPVTHVLLKEHAKKGHLPGLARRNNPFPTESLARSIGTSLRGALLSLSLAPASAQTSAPDTTSGAVPQNANPATSVDLFADDHAKAEPPPPWQTLTAGTGDRNPMRHADAVAALGTIGPSRRAVNLIERALVDKDSSIRQLAAMTLGEIRARSSISKLKQALHDDSPEVGFAVARAL